MEIMLFGLLLWSLIHFVPSLAQPVKKGWINILGEIGYKISFSAIVIFSLILIVYGWRHSTPVNIYALPIIVKPIAVIVMILAFVLFGVAKHPTRIKTFVRHPQLTSIIVWSGAHLLANGDSRSIVLFGWMGIWAALEIIFISRREGVWIKEPPPSWPQELKGLAISLVVFIVAAVAHPYIAGVPLK
jgi:uncharacterized membrane protein